MEQPNAFDVGGKSKRLNACLFNYMTSSDMIRTILLGPNPGHVQARGSLPYLEYSLYKWPLIKNYCKFSDKSHQKATLEESSHPTFTLYKMLEGNAVHICVSSALKK